MTSGAVKTCRVFVLLAAVMSANAFADGMETLRLEDRQLLNQAQTPKYRIGKDYVLGLHKYRLDHETEVLGWQVSDSIYFGRQRGEDSGLTLVWQQANNQVSLSKDGLRLTRRF